MYNQQILKHLYQICRKLCVKSHINNNWKGILAFHILRLKIAQLKIFQVPQDMSYTYEIYYKSQVVINYKTWTYYTLRNKEEHWQFNILWTLSIVLYNISVFVCIELGYD